MEHYKESNYCGASINTRHSIEILYILCTAVFIGAGSNLAESSSSEKLSWIRMNTLSLSSSVAAIPSQINLFPSL